MVNTPGLIESRVQIADLIHRYAYNVRHRATDGSYEMFCNDAEFIVRELKMESGSVAAVRAHLVGRAEVLEYIRSSAAKMALCPLIHNLLIEVDGATAQSTCVMENRTWPAISGLIGEYADSFQFAGQWRFAKRIYTMYLD